jgi:hypothetical protein
MMHGQTLIKCKHHFIHAVPLLHFSALKGPSSGSTDTFYEQLTKYLSRCKYQIKEESVIYYVTVDSCYCILEILRFIPIASRQLLFYYLLGRPRLYYICM